MKLKNTLLTTLLWTTILGLGSSFMILAGFYLYLSPGLPSVESVRDFRFQTPLRVYTSDGKLIGEFGEKRRYPIEFEDIPQDFVNALIAAEDDDFYSHSGVSLKGLMRAVSHLVLTGRKGSGGSTLTMQLTRHVFLSLRQTFSRKFNEILLAMRLEKELTKQEILEMYVNLMFLGKRAYGIEAAAEVYYGKTISELSLAQHAMLVGVFKGPSTQNPIANPQKAMERRNYVLSRMRKLDYITEEQYQASLAEPVTAKFHSGKIEVDAPYVAEMARAKAVELFGVEEAYTEGYKVYTTARADLQVRAQEAVVSGLITYDARHGYRGPEQQLDLADAPELELAEPEQSTTAPELLRDFSSWLGTIQSIPSYGQLAPAVVVQVEEKSITALTKGGNYQVIEWESGLSSARPYITENSRGPRPKTASDVAQVGDVVRLRMDKESNAWHLAQIPAAQSSLVALSPGNGAILALVGGFDFDHSNFNRAIQAQRQPGSNFKPFIYTAALESGLTAATIINDAPMVFDDKQLESSWRPENSDHKFYGPTSLRHALRRSINLVSIRLLDRIGINQAINNLEKFGFSPDALPRDLSLALGTHAVTPLDIAKGYAIFANGGYRVSPYVVQHIESFEGETLYRAMPMTVCKSCDTSLPSEHNQDVDLTEETQLTTDIAVDEPSEYELEEDAFSLSFETKASLGILKPEDYPRAPKVISDQVAYIIDSMLKDVIKRGTGYKAWQKFKRSDLAGKTGTTNGPVDAWFSGYHPDIVTSTWVGFDQNSPLGDREYGGSAALPIWMDFMELAISDIPITLPPQPSGVVSVRISPETGLRARPDDPDAIFEIFRTEYVPKLANPSETDPWKQEKEENINEELF